MFNVKYHIVGLISASMMLTACGGSDPVEVVDLDKVLDVVTATFDTLDSASPDGVGETAVDPAQSDEKMQDFLVLCTANLNDAKIVSQPIGLALLSEGAFEGFMDPNQNGTKDSGEKQIFKVEIDAERNRLIASDTQYQRDAGFNPTGLLAGLLIGSMLSRQRASGVNTNRFKNQKMSPKSYHSSAVSKASSSASARSRSSSGSYSSGK